MDQQPKIPTLKDTQKPQVKIKGLGAGLTLVDRLKQFKKKDLAFILAGLGTLFMAPLAEHFMMSPEGGDGQLQQGWGKGSGANGIFGGGGTPYETNNSIASGGAIGGSGDIITPLNVRDPSSLVLGPGAAQQPPAGSIAPPTAPAHTEADYKDALAGSAARGASAAARNAPLPMPKVSLGSMGLRGLGVAGGGSSASGSLAPITGGPGGRADTGGGGLNLVRSAPNFKGAAGPRGSGNPTGLDATKRAGQNAGDAFSRTGGALSALNEAAKETIPTGGAGFGGGGQGGFGPNDKFPGGNGPGGSKSIGESLAFIQAKERMMQDMQLAFEKRKLKDPELLLYGARNDMVKSMASEGIGKALNAHINSFLTRGWSDPEYHCVGEYNMGDLKKSQMVPPCGSPAADGKTPADPAGGCWQQAFGTSGAMQLLIPSGNSRRIAMTCTPSGKTSPSGKDGLQQGVTSMSANLGATPALAGGIDTICTEIDAQLASYKTPVAGATRVEGLKGSSEQHYNTMRIQADQLLTARNALIGGKEDARCGLFNGAPVEAAQGLVLSDLSAGNDPKSAGTAPALLGVVSKTLAEAEPGLTSANLALESAKKRHALAAEALSVAKTALTALKGDDQTFKLARGESAANLPGMYKTMETANKLKEKLDLVVKEAEARQEILSKAQVDLGIAAKQKGLAETLAGVNTRIVEMSSKTKLLIDADKSPQGERIPVVKEAAPVEQALKAAQDALDALDKLCADLNCGGNVDAAKNPEAVKEAVTAATAVRSARLVETGYVDGILGTLNALAPKAPEATKP